MRRPPSTSVYLIVLVPIVLWGTSFVAAKIALVSISPLGLSWARSLLGLSTLLMLSPLRSRAADDPRAGDGTILLLLAIMGVVAQSLLQGYALTMTSAIHSGWLIAMIPLFTALLSGLVLKERFPAAKIAGTVLGFGGALTVMASGGALARGFVPSTIGDLLILVSALNWAVYTLLARSLLRRRAALPVTLRSFAIGVAVLTLLAVAFGKPAELLHAGRGAWAAALFLGIGCTGIGWLCWSYALEYFEPGTLTSFQYLQPVVTTVSAAAWLGEPLQTSTLIGGALALAGVVWVQQAARRD